jgi:hypothetical protein
MKISALRLDRRHPQKVTETAANGKIKTSPLPKNRRTRQHRMLI